MPRLPRYFAPGVPLHIIARGNNRESIFKAPQDFGTYRKYLGEAARAHALAIHAYVVMSNHVHLLVTPSAATSAPRTMQSIGDRYAKYFNFIHSRTGTVWEGRYKATAVETDSYFLTCMRYIEMNPVRAGMVEGPERYRWSSFAANGLGVHDSLITTHPLYAALGDGRRRTAAYRTLFSTPLSNVQIEEIRDATNHGWALGSTRFATEVETVSGRRARRIPLGRPKRATSAEPRLPGISSV